MSERLSRITHKKAERVPGEDPVEGEDDEPEEALVRRIAWIKYYVGRGELDQARDLGWTGDLSFIEGEGEQDRTTQAATAAASASEVSSRAPVPKPLGFLGYMAASPHIRMVCAIVLYIGTGTLGGLAFSAIELPVEQEAAAAARDSVRELRTHHATLSAALDNDSNAKASLDALMAAVSVDGIAIDDDLDAPAHLNWEFESSFFFCVTLMTTIGYGSFAPATTAGRILAIPFSLIGICITGLVLSLLAVDIDLAITWLVKAVQLDHQPSS